MDQYLRSFQWNKVKYRADKSLAELIDLLSKVSELGFLSAIMNNINVPHLQEAASIDNDIRFKYSQYNQVKNSLATLQRKQACVAPTYEDIYLHGYL